MTRKASPYALFRRFHGRAPTYKETKIFYEPRTLIPLGRIVSVTYESDKYHGGGDGKPAYYVHEFETYATLYMDERAGKQLYILGSKIIVTEDGIEN